MQKLNLWASQREVESFIILEAKEDTMVVEASVTTTTHIYLLSGFICGAQDPRNSLLSDKRINANSNQFCEIVYISGLCLGDYVLVCSCVFV